MKLNDMKIGTRLVAGSALVMGLLLTAAGIGVMRIEHLRGQTQEITNVADAEIRLVTTMGNAALDLRIGLGNVVTMTDATGAKEETERVGQDLKRYADAREQLAQKFSAPGPATAKKQALLADADRKAAAAAPLIARVLELGAGGHNDEAARLLMGDLRPRQKAWRGALDAIVRFEEQRSEQLLASVDSEYRSARALIVALIGAIIAFGAGVTWLITRSITVPISDAVRLAETVASGDLTSRIASASGDETGRLLSALGDMNGSLVEIVSEVRAGTDTIASSALQIASGTAELSARTEQQAAALEETASTMEELTSTVKQNADNASQASALAASASDVAIEGGAVVAQVVETVDAIHTSSRKIVEIIGVIDGIAFQTNILALNASVEAARAGEHGRGFAVVAGEVRMLAQRCANAAKEIKVLIDDSVAHVDTGNALVAQAGTTISRVVTSVRQVSNIVNEIAAASREQSLAIEQVNQAIGAMDNVTQKNAALV
ncbi:MAG: MCP four helix bundle domain-containing protein, partial [Burkholderiaceae bacterium]|nr:MCP four helix bundle domain-containing protein [Burkholderiaceae bacterium]